MPQIRTTNDSILTVLQEIVAHGPNQQTTVIICSSRTEFLDQLQHSVKTWQPPRDEIPASQEDLDDPSADTASVEPEKKHTFLAPTLHLLATSQNIKLAFCPSTNALRAYLSTLDACGYATRSTEISSLSAKLVVIDLLAIHRGTSEFTLQGLSRTFATLASTAHRTKVNLQLIECMDVFDPTSSDRGVVLWDAEVPLLSGSVKIGGAGVNWAGRTIPIRRVVERWFTFD